MKRRRRGVIVIPSIICILSILLVTNYLTTWWFSTTFKETFENGFDEWRLDAEVPLDPNNPRNPVEWHIRLTTTESYSDQHALEFFIDGSQDEGAIWIERLFTVKPNARIRIRITFRVYSDWESFNSIAGVLVHLDRFDPETESDFTILGPANQVVGWKTYEFSTRLRTDATGTVWIGVGINVLWETYMTYYIDDVVINISPMIF